MSKLTTLVTGASSGIGAAVCRRIATSGHQLLIHARGGSDGSDRARLQQVADELRDRGAIVETVYADLAERGTGKLIVDTALDRFGGLDQIVSNAGFADRRHFGHVDRETLDRSLTSMTGAFFDMATAAMEALRSSSCGRVVAISSFAAHHYTPDTLFPVTSAAKSAVEALAKSLAVQLGPHQVTVNCIVPGYTQKDAGAHRAISPEALQEAANRSLTKCISQPDDIAAAVQFLLSEDARQITGQTIHVDGGLGVT